MSKFTDPLESIKIASPCSANWDEMYGNERRRLCGSCNLNVYNLSAMTKTEAESLIINTEGRLCARFFRRSDGTVVTKDCPVGLKAARRKASKVWTAFASMVVTAFAGIGLTTLATKAPGRFETSGTIYEEPLTGDVAYEVPDPNHEELEISVGVLDLRDEGGDWTLGKPDVHSEEKITNLDGLDQ